MNPDLILLFPQWQGAGDPTKPDVGALRESARTIAEVVRSRSTGDSSVRDVAIAEDARSVEGSPIRGHATVLEQARAARSIVEEEQPSRIFTVGGDCGVEVAPVGYLAERHSGLCVLWFDAHADLNTPDSSPSGNFHGMPLRHLVGEGHPDFAELVPRPLGPNDLRVIGVRTLDPAEERYVVRFAVPRFSAKAVNAERIDPLLRSIGDRPIYIHLDLDVLDPAEFPDVLYPVQRGIRVDGIVSILNVLNERCTVVGAGLTEYVDRGGDSSPAVERILDAIL